MPHHLMNLRHVPDDEADEIRALFDAHDVACIRFNHHQRGLFRAGGRVDSPDRRGVPVCSD